MVIKSLVYNTYQRVHCEIAYASHLWVKGLRKLNKPELFHYIDTLVFLSMPQYMDVIHTSITSVLHLTYVCLTV